jgi:hypothetical protein
MCDPVLQAGFVHLCPCELDIICLLDIASFTELEFPVAKSDSIPQIYVFFIEPYLRQGTVFDITEYVISEEIIAAQDHIAFKVDVAV